MRDLLLITPLEATAVVLATTGMYLSMVLVVRALGARVLSKMSGFDLAAAIAFGSVIGRASLGESPVLAGGVIALLTLVVLQAVAGQVRARTWGSKAVTTSPVLLMAGPHVIEEHLRRCHIQPNELQAQLRLAGVRHPDEVAAVTLEASGDISVVRAGVRLDPQLFSGVVGASMLAPEAMR